MSEFGLQQIAENLVETRPMTREPVARVGAGVAYVRSGIAAVAIFATSVAVGFGGAAGVGDLLRKRESTNTVPPAGASQAVVTPSVLSAEISRNISTRAKAARRYLQVLPKDETPDPDWF